jgi:hypothetical protein
MKNRAVFIISYKRAHNIETLKWLQKVGYKGKWYIVIDDKDPEIDEYKKLYGKNLCIFSKAEAEKLFDKCDNFSNTNSSCFVRNALFGVAKGVGIDSFLVLDDDYTNILYRRPKNGKLGVAYMGEGDFDKVLDICFNYLEKTPRIDCFAFSQEGDFIGGVDGFDSISGKRKIMNAFFFRTDNPTSFPGKMNEDVNAYLYWGSRGKLYFTTVSATIHQALTQQVAGGMTDIYKNNGTYMKSFYSVIVAPNAVKISVIGAHSPRIHHKISWNNAVPKLIREEYKKK